MVEKFFFLEKKHEIEQRVAKSGSTDYLLKDKRAVVKEY